MLLSELDAARGQDHAPVAALPALREAESWNGPGGIKAFRDRLRALMTDPLSPDWLKTQCETLKRTQICHRTGPGRWRYDHEANDPSEAGVGQVVSVLANPNSTAEAIAAAAEALARWRELTPDQPTAP